MASTFSPTYLVYGLHELCKHIENSVFMKIKIVGEWWGQTLGGAPPRRGEGGLTCNVWGRRGGDAAQR